MVPLGIADPVGNFLMDLGSKGVWFKPDVKGSAVIGYLSY